MGDDGGGGEFASSPAAKRLKRVAEIVMVMSAMAGMRGGKDPTLVEKSMAAEARESLTKLCERIKPKDLFSSEAVRAIVEDLGLNKDVGIFKPPRISISDKILQTKRKLEGPKEISMNPYYPSPTFGPNQIGGVHSQPISSSAPQRSQINEKAPGIIKPGIAIPPQSGITTHNLRQNGPTHASQSNATTSQAQNAEKLKPEISTNEKAPGVHSGSLINPPPQQVPPFIPVYSTHSEISKKVQKIVQSKRDTSHPMWSPPSTEYMTKPIICQSCNVLINDAESLLICDSCDKAHHLKCLENVSGAKVGVPKAEWHCQRCVISSNGKPLPPKYGKVTRTVGQPKIAPAVKKDHVQNKSNGNNMSASSQIKPKNDTTSVVNNNNVNINNNNNPKEAVRVVRNENNETSVVVNNNNNNNNNKQVLGVEMKDNNIEVNKEKKEAGDQKPGIEKPGNEKPGKETREINWVGEAGEVIDGKIHYSACAINKVNYKLQDHVLISSDGTRLVPSKIKSLWESKEPNSKWAIVNPYYLPNDLPESVSCSSGGVEENEVYGSDNKQVISLELISGKCEVFSNDKFQAEIKKDNLTPIFLCRWKYDDTNGILRPITN